MLKNEKKANDIIVNEVDSLTKDLHLDNATLKRLTLKLKAAKTSSQLL
jgi:conjugal transfer/entry exclusion protein